MTKVTPAPRDPSPAPPPHTPTTPRSPTPSTDAGRNADTTAAGPVPNALTIDVEDYFHVASLAEVIRPDDWQGQEQRCVASTERLLALLETQQVRATFFVLGWVAEREPALVRRIQAQGHEIACHGYSHQLVYNQSQATFREETQRSKALLEDITGEPVLGYRAASYSITKRSLWALDELAEAGFVYDSSIFPIRHDRYGIPDAPPQPHLLSTPKGYPLIEFPMSAARLLGARLPVCGGGYFRLLPYWLTRWGLRQINRRGQPFVFYLHPWEVDPGQPRVEGLSKLSRFRHYNNLDRTLPRLEQLLGEFDFATARTTLERLKLLPREPLTQRIEIH